MPSKGSPRLTLRFTPLVLAAMDERIEKRNAKTPDKPWDRSDYIRYCVMADLGHQSRSKKASDKKRKSAIAGSVE